jgi:transposase
MVTATQIKRIAVVALAKAGIPPCDIIRHMAKSGMPVSRSSVNRWPKRYWNDPAYADRPRSGRPRKCSKKQEKEIVRLLSVPGATTRSVTGSLEEQKLPVLSTTAVRTLAKRQGFFFRGFQTKPELTTIQKINRLKFAVKHRRRLSENILFSDETTFYLGRRPNRRLNGQWCKKGQDAPIWGTKKYTFGKVKVWGGICANGTTALVYLDKGSLTATAYQEVLHEGLQGVDQRLFADSPWVFMQDGDPSHTAKSTRAWLERQGIQTLTSWPSNSPDLNPIENVWAIMKNRVYRRRPTTVEALKQIIQEVWNSLTVDLLRRLVDGIPKRLKEVVRKHGGPTKR